MSAQLALGIDVPDAPRGIGRPPRPGWIRLSEPGRKLDALYEHVTSGWRIRHCGHPTANCPYYAEDPAHPGTCTVTHNGQGFRTLEVALDSIEGVLRGELLATDEGCLGTTRRILSQEQLEDWRAAARARDARPRRRRR